MTDSLKAAAKAGDIKAIEALMNKAFEPKGVTVRVTNSGTLLKVVVRGKEPPDKALLPTMQKGLASINPQGFDQVIITARAIGKANAWSEQWELTGSRVGELSPVSTPPSFKPIVKTLASSQPPNMWYRSSWLVASILVLFPIGALWLLYLMGSGFAPETVSDSKPTNSSQEPVSAQTSDHLQDGKIHGYSAAVDAQAATTPDQWQAVADSWQVAISHLELVPREQADYAEAQTKIEEYRENKLAALSNKSRAEVAINPELKKSNLTRYREWLNEADPNASLVKSIELRSSDNEVLEVTVTIDFLAQNKEVQREVATGMQAQWARISNPTNPDRAYIWLKTPSGERFGGSHWTAGTRIYIDD